MRAVRTLPLGHGNRLRCLAPALSPRVLRVVLCPVWDHEALQRRRLAQSLKDFLYVPLGGIHAFKNESGASASTLILFAPGIARERYFEEIAEIRRSDRQLTDAEWEELLVRHDQVNL
jgi:hypothetical protein